MGQAVTEALGEVGQGAHVARVAHLHNSKA